MPGHRSVVVADRLSSRVGAGPFRVGLAHFGLGLADFGLELADFRRVPKVQEQHEQKVFPFRANLAKAPGSGMSRYERTGWLTPGEVETLFADALWAGSGSRLEVSVPATASDAGVTSIRERFERLRRRGIGVQVRRDASWNFERARRQRPS